MLTVGRERRGPEKTLFEIGENRFEEVKCFKCIVTVISNQQREDEKFYGGFKWDVMHTTGTVILEDFRPLAGSANDELQNCGQTSGTHGMDTIYSTQREKEKIQ